MNHIIGAIYHLLPSSQYGIWTRIRFKGHSGDLWIIQQSGDTLSSWEECFWISRITFVGLASSCITEAGTCHPADAKPDRGCHGEYGYRDMGLSLNGYTTGLYTTVQIIIRDRVVAPSVQPKPRMRLLAIRARLKTPSKGIIQGLCRVLVIKGLHCRKEFSPWLI